MSDFKERAKNNLQSLLNPELDDDLSIDSGSTALDVIKREASELVKNELDNISEVAINKAKKVVSSCMEFYYKESWISKNDYIQARAEAEKLTIVGLYKQIGLNNKMIEDLAEKILNSGSPITSMARIYEVFAKLQEVNLNFSRQITMQIVALDEQMKRLKVDHEFYQGRGEKAGEDNTIEINYREEKTTFRGQKDLMRHLKKDKNTEESDD